MEMAMEVTSKTVAPPSAREKGKEHAIETTGKGNKKIIESSSSFASTNGKESAIGTNSNGKESETQNSQLIAICAASSSSFAPAGFSLETKSHPFRPNNNNIGDIFQIGQSSFSKNLAYSNSNHQYSAPPPDSSSSVGKVGGSRSIPENYQMQISSSLFHNTDDYETESGSSFSSLPENSNSINNDISTFSLGTGIANSIGINSRFTGFPFMIENPMGSVNSSSELGSNFPSISMTEQSWMGGFGCGIPSINANANPARLGSTSNSFFPMVAMRPASSSFSFPSVIANPTELDSRFPMIISNPNPQEPDTNFCNSRVLMVTPTEPSSENPMMKLLDSSFLSMLTNPILEPAPTEFGSIFSSRIANTNPNRIGPGSSSSLTLIENPMPQPSGSSFSSVMDLGIRFHSTFDDSVDSGAGTSLSLSYGNSINTDFSSSSVLENSMDLENST